MAESEIVPLRHTFGLLQKDVWRYNNSARAVEAQAGDTQQNKHTGVLHYITKLTRCYWSGSPSVDQMFCCLHQLFLHLPLLDSSSRLITHLTAFIFLFQMPCECYSPSGHWCN